MPGVLSLLESFAREEEVTAVTMILIVEDDRALCDLLRSHLEGDGYQVIQAFDGPAALVAAELHHPQLILLDWMLPGMDGLAVCRRLRRHSLTPIIMLTARIEEVDQILGLEVGADDYIAKPFSIPRCWRAYVPRCAVSNWISSRSQRQKRSLVKHRKCCPPHPIPLHPSCAVPSISLLLSAWCGSTARRST